MEQGLKFKLEKSFNFVLEKRELFDVKARVADVSDVSGSIKHLYDNGTMQKVSEREMIVALRFDDDGNLDQWSFATDTQRLPQANINNIDGYVGKYIAKSRPCWGWTNIATPLADIYKFYFEETPPPVAKKAGFVGKLFGKQDEEAQAEDPVIIIFKTDGDNSDSDAAIEDQIRRLRAARVPVFIAFVGLRTDVRTTFKLLKYLANKYDHVGFVEIEDIGSMDDDDLYEALISEKLATWLKVN